LLFTEQLTDATAPDRRILVLQTVTDEVLRNWNAGATFKDMGATASEMLAQWLGHRITVEGRLPEFINRVIGASENANSFLIGDKILLNPFGLIQEGLLSNPKLGLSPIIGFSHGDLHGGNILIHRENPRNFYIIDFGFYESTAPLLFDLAYLELSLLIHERRNSSSLRLRDLVSAFRDFEDSREVSKAAKTSDDEGLLRAVGHLRSRITAWRVAQHPERKEDIRKQLLLARIAAGLNFANKSTLCDHAASSDRLRLFSFEWAASNLQKLLEFCRVEVELKPQQVAPGAPKEPASDAWRAVWSECDGFNESRNIFILIVGTQVRELPSECKAALLSAPWSLVFDFDDSGDDRSIFSQARTIIARRRSFQHLLPGQEVARNFYGITHWLSVNGLRTMSSQAYGNLNEWRKAVSATIAELGQHLARATAPQPVTIVVLGAGAATDRLTRTWESLDNHLQDARTVFVLDDDTDESAAVSGTDSSSTRFNVTYRDLALGLGVMLGDFGGGGGATVPIRESKTGTISRGVVEAVDFVRMAEAFELVHDGLVDTPSYEDDDAADFLHGAPITWQELDRNVDLIREDYPKLMAMVRGALAASRTVALTLRHTPGAGGSTVARRIAWDLRNDHPVIVLKRWSEISSDRISLLAEFTGLPILAIVEGGVFSEGQRQHLFLDARSRQMRLVTLEIVRARNTVEAPPNTFLLEDPMPKREASRFRDRYRNLAPLGRHSRLNELATNDDYADVRSPFFFAFYAFEEKFIRISDFVGNQLANLAEEQSKLIAFIALVTAYSQQRMPIEVLSRISGNVGGRYPKLRELIGESGKRLVVGGASVSLGHPMIAMEVLKQYLQPGEQSSPTAWRAALGDFCCEFISRISQSIPEDSDATEELLSQIFTHRAGAQSGGGYEAQFSALITELPSEQSGRRVLEALCSAFDNNPHFWNHLGRYTNMRAKAPYVESEAYLRKAINAAEARGEDVGLHWHGLGMVYRFEVSARLERARGEDKDPISALGTVRDIFANAEECFHCARESDSADEHGHITHVQMITEAVEHLMRLSRKNDYAAFLRANGIVESWCRERIAKAEELLDRLRHIQVEGTPSKYLVGCESKLQGLCGNFDAMISGLASLLDRQDVAKAPIRRSMAWAYLRNTQRSGNALKQQTAQRIAEMALANLRENPGSRHDAVLWLRGFRVLPEFTISRAMEQIGFLEQESDSIEANYYLYILHFLNYRAGGHASLKEALKHIEICKRKTHPFLAKRSFEWLGSAALGRPCPLVHHSELGEWDKALEFFGQREKLAPIEGFISEIKGEQSGSLRVGEMPAFFVPGQGGFRKGVDNNVAVKAVIGFSYEGLRAWTVKRAE
jgi:hypothetical protein